MNDFMRTALYDAVHNIIPVIKNSKKNKGPLEFVGPICETTCKFIKYNKYQKLINLIMLLSLMLALMVLLYLQIIILNL